MSSLPPAGPLSADPGLRLERARLALDGLSVGDAFGQRFFYAPSVESLIAERAVPQPPWRYTDDTEMALAIVEVLERHGRIDQDDLARTFARRYDADPGRGYGPMAHEILEAIGAGQPWQAVAGAAFAGMGSMGNGAAMRVAPLGAYFADDPDAVVDQARASAAVTHAHPEGQAGAIAVATAAAWAWRTRSDPGRSGRQLLETVLVYTPEGDTRRGVARALELSFDVVVQTAVGVLGNGSQVIASDTVPFTLWCAARHLGSYEEALWTTVAGLGDRDTTCAIVGGIVALSAGLALPAARGSIPAGWLAAREPLGVPVK